MMIMQVSLLEGNILNIYYEKIRVILEGEHLTHNGKG